MTGERWPVPTFDAAGLPLPEVAVEEDYLGLWYGEAERPALTLDPISMVELRLGGGSESS
jgi:hypothetical protein